jgi:hypothetical protein
VGRRLKRIFPAREIPGIAALAALAAAAKSNQDGAMRHFPASIAAVIALCWAAVCGPYDSNTWPLAIGMTPQQAADALGMQLTYHSGARGSEIFIAGGSAGVPGRFPVDAEIALQFRGGRLSGWKKNWSLPRPWIIY